jgi:cytochrome P450
MTAITLGPGPSLDEALEDVRRVGQLVGGETAKKWARELREIATLLGEGKPRGPKGSLWPREASRLKLACTIAGIGHRNREGLAGAKALAAKLEELAGKSLAPEDQAQVLALHRGLVAAVREEVEQIRLEKKAAGDPLETLDEAVAVTTGSSSPLDDALGRLAAL